MAFTPGPEKIPANYVFGPVFAIIRAIEEETKTSEYGKVTKKRKLLPNNKVKVAFLGTFSIRNQLFVQIFNTLEKGKHENCHEPSKK